MENVQITKEYCETYLIPRLNDAYHLVSEMYETFLEFISTLSVTDIFPRDCQIITNDLEDLCDYICEKVESIYDFVKPSNKKNENFATDFDNMVIFIAEIQIFITEQSQFLGNLIEETKQLNIQRNEIKPTLSTRCLTKKKAVLLNGDCCICLENSEYTDKIILNCSHSCCVNCTKTLLDNESLVQIPCPLCRTGIKTIILPYTVSHAKNAIKNNKSIVLNSKHALTLKPYCK